MTDKILLILQSLLAICVLNAVFGCSGDSASQSVGQITTDQGTGAITARLDWGSAAKAAVKAVSSAPAGVATVRIIIAGSGMTQAVQKDFAVAAGSGTIDGIPAGTGRTVTAQGLSSAGSVLYQGVVTGITVVAGQTTDIGTITLLPHPTATAIPLTTRSHMDAATQAAYDRIRAGQGWLLGVDALGAAANPFVTVPTNLVQSRWSALYGAATGLPACIEWEMGERNRASAQRDWAGLTAFSDAGGLPWIMLSLNNFTVPFGNGVPPRGGMNDTTNRAAGVLPGGSGNEAFVAYVRQLAREVRAIGRPIVFRPFHEGNGGWFWWGGSASDFKALWALTFKIFQEEQVSNVIWLWAVSDICSGNSCSAAAFYPGDDMVDMLGIDLYFNGATFPDSAVKTLSSMESLGLDKPIVIAELGPVARADFWSQAASLFAGIKRFRGFSLWFARGWKVWGGDPLTGSLIDSSTDSATQAAFMLFLKDSRLVTLPK